jgi:hypothetical protein
MYLQSATNGDASHSTPPPASPSPPISPMAPRGVRGPDAGVPPIHPSVPASSGVPPPPQIDPAVALEKLTNSRLGVDLPEHIIAHDEHVQRLLDDAKIAWGVMYEIARGICQNRWTWADVGRKVEALKGLNQDVGWRVAGIILDKEVRGGDLAIWWVYFFTYLSLCFLF